ncbi:hypothetical protein [Mariniphaga sediminis]|uniref:hypothetical protein n=2 Tax=Mariniphaga sediminis TaxID=1628158 RepID=UPI0019D47EA8|nr:hypothetical protein [Mariniphaga sediminis]
MLKTFLLKTMLIVVFGGFAIITEAQNNELVTDADSKYFRLVPGSENSTFNRVELFSDIDTTWEKWKIRGYNFGFNPKVTPMYTTVNGILSTPYMIQVRGNENERNKKRWGFHVFEGYANDDMSRITMLVNKHVEMGKPVAEMYYYGTVYNHSDDAYNWFRIGSDVKQHSFLFSRDKAVFYGSLKLSNALTLGNIGKNNLRKEIPEGDDEQNAEESAKHVNFRELKNSGDGTIFYDSDNHIVAIKIEGKWMKLKVEELPKGVSYDFD